MCSRKCKEASVDGVKRACEGGNRRVRSCKASQSKNSGFYYQKGVHVSPLGVRHYEWSHITITGRKTITSSKPSRS